VENVFFGLTVVGFLAAVGGLAWIALLSSRTNERFSASVRSVSIVTSEIRNVGARLDGSIRKLSDDQDGIRTETKSGLESAASHEERERRALLGTINALAQRNREEHEQQRQYADRMNEDNRDRMTATEARAEDDRRRAAEAVERLRTEVRAGLDAVSSVADEDRVRLSAGLEQARSEARAGLEAARSRSEEENRRLETRVERSEVEARERLDALTTRADEDRRRTAEEARQTRDEAHQAVARLQEDTRRSLEASAARAEEERRRVHDAFSGLQSEVRAGLHALAEEGRAERRRLSDEVQRFEAEIQNGWQAFSNREESARQALQNRVEWYEEGTRRRVQQLEELAQRTRTRIQELEDYLKNFFEAELKSVFRSLDGTVGSVLGEMKSELLRGVSRIEDIEMVVRGQKGAEARVLRGEVEAYAVLKEAVTPPDEASLDETASAAPVAPPVRHQWRRERPRVRVASPLSAGRRERRTPGPRSLVALLAAGGRRP
jgi:hypothetical protein